MNFCASTCIDDFNNLSQKVGLLFDITLCIGTPLILIILCELLSTSYAVFLLTTERKAYIVQSGRFEIVEEFGCANASIYSGLTLLFINFVPVTSSVLSLTLYSRKLISYSFL